MSPVTILVYAVAVLLLISVGLYIKAALFDKRPQKVGLIAIVLSIPLYLTYFADHLPFGDHTGDAGRHTPGGPWVADPDVALSNFPTRILVDPLRNFENADVHFRSDFSPALIIAVILLVHMTVFQRVAVRRRLQRIHDPIATFLAVAAMATLIGGGVVSTFHWGWQGALIVGGVFTMVYLGALALLAALIELFVELSKLFMVWLKRKVFALATLITRIASWISSLGGRLVSRNLIEKIREDTARQENIFAGEQDDQDRRLEDAYVRDRRRAAKRRGKLPEQLLGPDASAPAAGGKGKSAAPAQPSAPATVPAQPGLEHSPAPVAAAPADPDATA
jgi:hypothetical protein